MMRSMHKKLRLFSKQLWQKLAVDAGMACKNEAFLFFDVK